MSAAARNTCRFLPRDESVINAFVHTVVVQSRVLHGRHPDTNEPLAKPGMPVSLEGVDHKALDKGILLARLASDLDPNDILCDRAGTLEKFTPISVCDNDVLKEFKEFVEKDSQINKLFTQMFQQAPPLSSGDQQITNINELFEFFNTIIKAPPKYAEGPSAMVAAVPFYAALARFCNTPAGVAAFTDTKVDGYFRTMLQGWQNFLGTDDATYWFNDDKENGWFGEKAVSSMVAAAGQSGKKFQEVFVCDPTDTSGKHGFGKYDSFVELDDQGHQKKENGKYVSFFAKELLALQDLGGIPLPDDPRFISMACTSTIHTLTYQGNDDKLRLQPESRFWIKETPYSLRHILGGDPSMGANDPRVQPFVHGSLVQAMLSSLDYHGWRSPVKGTICDQYIIPGTHYSGLLDPTSEDPDPISRSQDFVTAVSTRAVIVIDAGDPVGRMAFVGVGLGEVSSCQILVEKGQEVKKGQVLGYFHFGGSTHLLIFGPHVRLAPNVGDFTKNPDRSLEGTKFFVGDHAFTAERRNVPNPLH